MYHTTKDGQRLYYEIKGNENATKIIVFLNGLSQTTAAWDGIVAGLQSEYKMILIDLIFQGQSDKAGEWRTFDQHAEDVVLLLKNITTKQQQITICGLSYGGMVAQHLAYNYPDLVHKLVLMATFAHKTPYFEAIEWAWHRALEAGGYSLLLDVMLPTVLSEHYFTYPLIPIEQLKLARQGLNDATALKKLMTATEKRPDYRPFLQKIKCPTLVIAGEQDVLFPVHIVAEMAEAIPQSRLEVISQAGHTLNLEAIPQCVALLRNFLAE